jgi:hypothetical protein
VTSEPTDAHVSEPAGDVYEIVVEETASHKTLLRSALTFVVGTRTMRSRSMDTGGMIISVLNKESGEEIFRHIEEMASDEDPLLVGIRKDLASMTAKEFAARWRS